MRHDPSHLIPKIAALVPMRHNSERVAGKNYRSFAGEPLYRHIVRSLLACPLISRIVIDTDSPVIKKDVSDVFPRVILIDRPPHLSDGTVAMNDVLKYDISRIEGEYFLQTHSTNPLLSHQTITEAIQKFFDNYPTYDSLFSVSRMAVRLWDSKGKPVNHNPEILLRTQDLPPIYEENSCMYIFPRTLMETRNNRIGVHPLMFEIDKIESFDIDEEMDFKVAEFLHKTYYKYKEALADEMESIDISTLHATGD
ncbi:MAG: acylneuraminate cytidylyltransferase family protein [Desulfobacteraceae bacterium]|nr:acylneuraminate cytidylyltransferase family protein [Desulfobacteraceae bacterium]